MKITFPDCRVWEQGAWRRPGEGQQKNARNNPRRMFVAGKYIPASHPFHRPGNYSSWSEVQKGLSEIEVGEVDTNLLRIRRKLRKLYKASDRKQEQIDEGFVYVIRNPAFKGWCKVGHSIEPTRRLSQYQTATPHRDFHLEGFYYTPNRAETEKRVHGALELIAYRAENEWFSVDPKIAAAVADHACRSARHSAGEGDE